MTGQPQLMRVDSTPPDSLMQAFARGERELTVPASIAIEQPDGRRVLETIAVLRLLPRKRLVLRGTIDGREVAVKWFAVNAHGQLHVQREHAGAAAVWAAGLHAPEILREITTPDGRHVGLVYAWIDGAPELGRLWQNFDTEEKSHWLRELVALLAQLHATGAHQSDIHLGNFLLQADTLWLLDLGTVEHRADPLDATHSLKNLAALAAQLPPDDRSLLDALLPNYLQLRGWKNTPATQQIYRAALARAWQERCEDYLEKASRDCSLTRVVRSFSAFCAARRSVWSADLAKFYASPEAAFVGAELLKAGNTATVVRGVLDGAAVVIKRYNIKSWRHALSRCWRPTRAAHSWRYAHLLEIAGIRSPQPIALLEQRRAWLRGRAYFVCAAIDGVNLLTLGERGALAPNVLASLREILFALQRERISHGDFKATNFLADEHGVALIDLDAMRQHRSEARFRRAFTRDLRRLQRNWPEGMPVRAQIDGLIADILTRKG